MRKLSMPLDQASRHFLDRVVVDELAKRARHGVGDERRFDADRIDLIVRNAEAGKGVVRDGFGAAGSGAGIDIAEIDAEDRSADISGCQPQR